MRKCRLCGHTCHKDSAFNCAAPVSHEGPNGGDVVLPCTCSKCRCESCDWVNVPRPAIAYVADPWGIIACCFVGSMLTHFFLVFLNWGIRETLLTWFRWRKIR